MKTGFTIYISKLGSIFALALIMGVGIAANAQTKSTEPPTITTPKKQTGTSRSLPDIQSLLSVYPDPATGNLNIKWENQPKGSANVVIADTAGTEVYSKTFSINTTSGQIQLDLATFKEGDYRITITSDKMSFYGKVSVLP